MKSLASDGRRAHSQRAGGGPGRATALPLSRWLRLTAVIFAAGLLAACQSELYGKLDQRQANEMIAILYQHGIPAVRVADKSGSYSVTVDDAFFAEAVRVLNDKGLPRRAFSGFCEVFKKEGLVSSPVEERGRMICAQKEELERTISEIEGVRTASVVLGLPENTPLRPQTTLSSAAVYISHRASARVDEVRIKTLVAKAVPGLAYDNIQVFRDTVEDQDTTKTAAPPQLYSFLGILVHEDSYQRAAWLFYGLLGLLLAAGAGLVALWWNLKRGVYTLARSAKVKAS